MIDQRYKAIILNASIVYTVFDHVSEREHMMTCCDVVLGMRLCAGVAVAHRVKSSGTMRCSDKSMMVSERTCASIMHASTTTVICI